MRVHIWGDIGMADRGLANLEERADVTTIGKVERAD